MSDTVRNPRFYGSGVKRFHIFIEELGDIGYGGGGVMMTVHLLDEISDFSRGNALLIELDDGSLQVFGSPFVRRDGLLIEFSQTVSGDLKL